MQEAKILKIVGVKFFSLKNPDVSYDSGDVLDMSSGSSTLAGHPCVHLARFYSSGTFYFSRERDLTLNSQKRVSTRENEGPFSIWNNIDERFFWNRYPLKDLVRIQKLMPNFVDVHRLLVPVIQGFFEVREVTVQGRSLKVALISRLSCERVGTRFNTRGLDDDGSVANFVETEQVCFNDEFCISFVQVRGSVPVFWEQKGIQVGAHKIDLSRGEVATKPAFRRHFERMSAYYNSCHIVNLLPDKGHGESVLSEIYRKLVGTSVNYTSFDLNAMCKGSNYENLFYLLKDVNEDLQNYGFFHFHLKTKQVLQQQKGIFRTNCVDCLDRSFPPCLLSIACLVIFSGSTL